VRVEILNGLAAVNRTCPLSVLSRQHSLQISEKTARYYRTASLMYIHFLTRIQRVRVIHTVCYSRMHPRSFAVGKEHRMNTSIKAIRRLQHEFRRASLKCNRGTAICASVCLLLLVTVYVATNPMAPIINDVCTDLDNPVEFTQNTKLNPFPEAFKAQVKAGYPDLKPLIVRLHVPRANRWKTLRKRIISLFYVSVCI
jgi:hypothetical protein